MKPLNIYIILCIIFNSIDLLGQQSISKILNKAEKSKITVLRKIFYDKIVINKSIFNKTVINDSVTVRGFNFKEFRETYYCNDTNKHIKIYYDNKNKIQKISCFHQDSTYINFDLILDYTSDYIFMFPIYHYGREKIISLEFFLYDRQQKLTTFWVFHPELCTTTFESYPDVTFYNVKYNCNHLENIILLDSMLNPIYRLNFAGRIIKSHSTYTNNNGVFYEENKYFSNLCNTPEHNESYINYSCFTLSEKIYKELKISNLYYLLFFAPNKCNNCVKNNTIISNPYKRPIWALL